MSGSQPISIGTGCGFIGTVLHELMHALGFFHTSSRHARDAYVVVMSKNIMKGKYICVFIEFDFVLTPQKRRKKNGQKFAVLTLPASLLLLDFLFYLMIAVVFQ